MKAKFAIPMLVAAVAATASTAASADEILNVLVGGGLGAAVGHAIGGHEGVLPGTVIGAIAGAAASQSEPRRVYERRAVYAYPPTYTYYQQPAVVYQAPPVVYTSTRVVYRDQHEWRHRHGDFRRGYRDDDDRGEGYYRRDRW